MITHAVSTDAAPINEMNTTPLIDVMLVLLIMIIMTMPLQSHAVKIDLPQAAQVRIDPLKNKLVITPDDRLLWNGEVVSRAWLKQIFVSMGRSPNQPELQMQPEPSARYALVDAILADAKRAQVTRLGFVGNESYRSF